uniref:Sphingomyelin synthase-like domain-containing protein n=1 Tax=Aureoumbra lagunensis TaxID=44058 RepID=A0A7S3K1H4_9STRA|mmetsp:Transcript_16901/g.25432  ORF Transcript_16901/g.25432 Transcript_16901/m.25432 type:complete len:484 (-) Transcript_16901:332-1783(-)
MVSREEQLLSPKAGSSPPSSPLSGNTSPVSQQQATFRSTTSQESLKKMIHNIHSQQKENDDAHAMILLDPLECARRRLCTREGIKELFGFMCWLLIISAHALQIWGLWWFFWQYVAAYQEGKPAIVRGVNAVAKGSSALGTTLAKRAARRRVAKNTASHAAAFAAWTGWLAFILILERPLLKRRLMPAPIFQVCRHAELFATAGLLMTICTNFASYLHSPGHRLFDLGFYLIPQISKKFYPLSDALTGALPVLAFSYLCLVLDRRRRCRAITDWFRMMTVVYLFRCITSTMTSLPGPAPHCAPSAYAKGAYLPPSTWHEIATSLSTGLTGGTCGDLLFSGHAAMTTITTLLLVRQQRRHGQKVERVAKAIGCTYILIVCIFALASRKHYTVDLALGTLIGSLTYFRFRDSWTRDPVSLDRLDAVVRFYGLADRLTDQHHHPYSADPRAAELSVVLDTAQDQCGGDTADRIERNPLCSVTSLSK